MDYEKAYKEALERAKSLICEEGLTEGSYPNRNACEAIFPELAESEDERIRKEIIHHILYKAHGVSEEQEHSWVAYLEKQKRQKQSEMEKNYVRTLQSLISDFLQGKQEIDREYYQKIWDWLDNRHIEQKDIKFLSWRAVDECKDIPDGHYVVVAYNSPGVFELDTVFNGKLSHPNRGNLKATGVFYIPNADENCMCILEKQKINTEGDFARGYDCGYEACLHSHGAEFFEKQKEQPVDAKSERVIKAARRVLNNWLDGTDCPDVSGDFAELEYAFREYDGEEKQKPDIEICPHSIKSKSYSEQKPESCDPDTNVEKVIEDVIRVYGKTQGEWIGGYDIDMLIVNLRRAFNMKSQKPAEWGKEDESNLQSCIAKIEIDMQHWDKHGKTMVDGDIKLIEWLKSLPERFELQPKREWDEKDKNKLYQVMETLIADKTIAQRNYPRCKALHKAYDELIDWLKSLRPQPQWKPSEEQLDALEYFVQKHKAEANAATGIWIDYENLVSLRNDLKKL